MQCINVKNIAWAILLLSVFNSAHAAISLSATRLVINENSGKASETKAHEASITVHNKDGKNMLLQSWLELDDTATKNIPFIVTPSLARLKIDGRQVLRILYRGTGMPRDKESVLWLNAQEIPQMSETPNTLQIAVRQRIKVFYRPKGLTGDANNAPTLLTWLLNTQGKHTVLTINNPSAYHVSILSLDGVTLKDAVQGHMFKPGESVDIPLKNIMPNAHPTVRFTSVNDWGGQILYEVQVAFDTPSSATLKNKY